MKGYKAFDADMKCRWKQYEAGQTYEEPEARLCETGIHFCEQPMAVLSYYPLVQEDGRLPGRRPVSRQAVTKWRKDPDSMPLWAFARINRILEIEAAAAREVCVVWR